MSTLLTAGTATSGATLSADTSGSLQIQTGSTPTTAITIDTSQNVGIGTSSPAGKLAITTAATVANALVITDAINYTLEAGYGGSGVGFIGGTASTALALWANNAEKARIDTSGNLLVGTTSKGSIPGNSIVVSNGYGGRAGVGGGLGGSAFNLYWTGSATQLWIDGTNTGTITVVSDYRLKDKVETQTTPALSRINQLRPVTYEFKDYGSIFKADGVAREGFIAHEVQAVIPSAVEGEKDSENQIQSLKLDALCSVMVKAIQEQQALITQLQADVAALKGAK